VPLRVLGFDFGLECSRRVRDGLERVEPTSDESSSSPLSWAGRDFHFVPRRSVLSAVSSCDVFR
jgi:hypothetical protein